MLNLGNFLIISRDVGSPKAVYKMKYTTVLIIILNGNVGEIRSLTPYSIIKYNKDRQIEDSNIDNTYL